MMSCGVDRRTGKPLSGWPHVAQSLGVIFATHFGDRVMRRIFGSAVPGILGKNLTPSTMLVFITAYAIACELWEPRFRPRRFLYPDAQNGPDLMRQGRLGLLLEGDYMPNALEGDFSVASSEKVVV